MRKIRNLLAAVFAFFLIIFGFTKRARKKTFGEKYITCIYFHNPSKKLFTKCIKWLKRNDYTFISSAQLAEILSGRESVPDSAVWLSFDDGWRRNVENVVPVLLEYNVPATFFISTGPVEDDGVFWWTYAEKFRQKIPEPFSRDISRLWEVPESERKNIIDKLKESTQGLSAKSNELNELKREAMTVEDVKNISKNSLITLGSHTANHVITVNCTAEELEYEIRSSKEKLESWTGKTVNTFAYPNGDFDGREEEFLRKYNFVLAAAAGNKFTAETDKVYRVPRLSIGDGYFIEELCHILGCWQPMVLKLKSLFK